MIGKLLREFRMRKGLRQAELSEILGIAQTTLSGYETSYSNPGFDMIEKICDHCDYEIIFRNKYDGSEFTMEVLDKIEV